MRVNKFSPELQLTTLQVARRGSGMNIPPAPNSGNKRSSVCLGLAPPGTKEVVTALVPCLG